MITIKNNGYIWLLRPWLFVPPSISTCLRSKTTLHLLSNGYVYNPFPVSLLHNFYIHLNLCLSDYYNNGDPNLTT